MIKCPICGAVSDTEIITHIETEHKGGLKRFLLLFSQLSVVNTELYSQAEQCVSAGATVANWPFDLTVANDIVEAHHSQIPERSQIIIKEDEYEMDF